MTEMSADEFPYQYFVSYAHATGSGNIQIGTRKPVQTYDAVKEFHRTICPRGTSPTARLWS